ncbi:hypothetical protein MicroSTF_08755 [Microbacterium sp. STF-2]|uniref:hypothetical protein n=1 Tax=Microbacterium sp. STF-2 TaxID=3031132 RepID=UPI002AFED07E|nr:hypothetical protein [Microbacterium sp. STF-2]MEA1263111.1 hypothetical protein [Microbacterium sp. STF-2]
MEYSGVVPTDAPDPSIESDARLQSLPFPVFELKPQRALTRLPVAGFMEISGAAGRDEVSASFSYTLWRHPDDHADPRNEIELDEPTRRSLTEEPPWGRPAWLIAQVQAFRYPMLWEAVRTTWHASPGREGASLAEQLAAHTDHILRNRFRGELGLSTDPVPTPTGPGSPPPPRHRTPRSRSTARSVPRCASTPTRSSTASASGSTSTSCAPR